MNRSNPLQRAGFVLGIGFGGFADGIILHQILGWHHLICVTEHCQPSSIAHLQRQNVQDGFFHLALWLITLVGTGLLFQAARHPGPTWNFQTLSGSMIAGWGIFNFVEGLIDHQILGIHHVLPGDVYQFWFDMLFLASGLALFLTGLHLSRRAKIHQS